MTSYGGGRDANPGGRGGTRRKIQTSGGSKKPPKKASCCPMVAAVGALGRGRFRLARRYAAMSVRLIAG